MLISVILSGGAGTRLWPASRQAHPKPFLRVADGESLLGKTLARALHVGSAEVVTVTSADHYHLSLDEYRRCDVQAPMRFLLEPAGRNTAPAILLAALDARVRHGGQAVLLVLPADHLIRDLDAFAAAVQAAQALARSGRLVTFGVRPSHPETGFGYIHAGAAIAGLGGRSVQAFVEKPDQDTAQRYLIDGNYYWNSGMFCFSVEALLGEAARACPDVLDAAQRCFATSDAQAEPLRFERDSFLQQPDISIDYALMERAAQRAVVPATFDWSDIGSWKAISELEAGDQHGNRHSGPAILIDSENCFVRSDGRLVAAVGVQDLVIVDSGDAVLIAHRDRTQAVREVVEQLRASSHDAARHHLTVQRPWGSYTVLEDAADCKVKRLVVKPGGILSLQKHHRRSEHWTVVTGTAKVRIGERELQLSCNESVYVPAGTLHRLENQTGSDIALIEVQCGDYFGEDDIVRLEDVYGRVPTG